MSVSRNPALPEIADTVGRLPLALEMLAVRLGQPAQAPAGVLEELRSAASEMDAFLQEAEGAGVPRPDGVFAAITGTLRRLPRDVRAAILGLGYVADQPVPDALALALCDLDPGAFAPVLRSCQGESVLAWREGAVTVHALTAAAIRATNREGLFEAAVARATPRLAAINTDAPVALRAEIEHHEAILRRASEALPDSSATLTYANSLAIGFLTLWRIGEAIRLHEGTLEIRERVLGAEHPDMLTSRNNQVIAYWRAGRTEEALRPEGGVGDA